MKKLLALLAVAGVMAACNSGNDENKNGDTTVVAPDTTMSTPVDTSSHMGDTTHMGTDTSHKGK